MKINVKVLIAMYFGFGLTVVPTFNIHNGKTFTF